MAHQKLGMSGYCSRRSNESEHSTDPLIRPILNPLYQLYIVISCYITIFQWIGWREKLQDTPRFDGQNSMGLRFWFSLQSNEFLEFQYWYGGSPVKNGGFSSEISIFPPFFQHFWNQHLHENHGARMISHQPPRCRVPQWRHRGTWRCTACCFSAFLRDFIGWSRILYIYIYYIWYMLGYIYMLDILYTFPRLDIYISLSLCII